MADSDDTPAGGGGDGPTDDAEGSSGAGRDALTDGADASGSADIDIMDEKSAEDNAETGGGEDARDPGDADENDSPPSEPARELSPSASTPISEAHDATPASPGRRHTKKQLEKLQRRVPGSLDLDYVTPQLIGMAPPRAKEGLPESQDVVQKSLSRGKKKRQKGNDPGELSTFLERRHPRRYLLFNVSDDEADDRSLLLLGRQVVHLPWGSPKIPHPHDSNNGTPARTPGDGSPSPYAHFRKGSDNGGGGNKSSGTPAVSRVMDICYALHAYLSMPPGELPQDMLEGKSASKRQRKGKHSHPPSTVACIYCGNGKTRTGVIVACYLRFCNEVPDALSGFEVFCERRGIMSSSSSADNNNDISSHIPPSLRQFFDNFDDVVQRKHYPFPEPLMLQSIHLQGVPVDDMPCVDIWEHGDVIRRQIYSSHDDVTMNEWDDEEGSYKIGQLLDQDFTLVCRFGGEFVADADDPSKVLFRYVNCPKFLKEGTLELGMADVDMMRRYADSFDDEDFSLTLTLEGVDDEMQFGSPGRKRGFPFFDGATKFDGTIREESDVRLQGWQVLSDAHLSHLLPETEEELDLDDQNSYKLICQGREVDFRLIAMQFTNGDAELAKAELVHGLFKSLFCSAVQDPTLESIQQPILEPLNDAEGRRSPFEHMGSTVSTVASTVELDDRSVGADEVFEATLSQLGNGQENEGQPTQPSPDSSEKSAQSDLAESREGEIAPPKAEENDTGVKDAAQADTGGDALEAKSTEESGDQSQHLPPISDAISEVESDAAEGEVPMESLQSYPSIDATETEETPPTNDAFADQSQSSLLEAIKMRGLKKSMMSVGNDEHRSSLLMEIRRSSSSGKAESATESPAKPPSNVVGDGTTAIKSIDTGAAEYLPSTLVLDTAGVVDFESLDIDQSDTTDRAVMMMENDQSVSTGNEYEKDRSGDESDGIVGDQAASSEHVNRDQASGIADRSPVSKARKIIGVSDVDALRKVECPTSPSLKEDPLFEKFYGMLQSGLPMGEVQSAMQRDKVDPKLLDFERLSISLQIKPVDGSLTLTADDQVSALPDDKEEDEQSATSDLMEEEEQKDPRAALAAMLSKRAPPTNEAAQPGIISAASNAKHVGEDIGAQQDEPESEGGEEQMDPREALTAMLTNRTKPAEPQESISAPPPSDGDGGAVDGEEWVPLTAMQNKSTPSTDDAEEQEGIAAPPPSDGDGIAQRAIQSDEDEWVPLAAAPDKDPPPTDDSGHPERTSTPPPSDGVRQQTDEEAWVPLAAVPKKRAPPSSDSDVPESVSPSPPLDEDVIGREDKPVQSDEEEEQKDPKAALTAMLSKRAAPTTDVEQTETLSAPSPTDDGVKQEGEAVQSDDREEATDPRAALMAMLSKRAPPVDAEQRESVSSPPPTDGGGAGQEEEQKDPRAALMTMLSKRAPPSHPAAGVEQPDRTSPPPADGDGVKQEDETVQSDEEEEPKDPRAALMTMLSQRAHVADIEQPETLVPKLSSEDDVTQGDGVAHSDEEEKDPRAALMAMLSKKAPPAESDQPPKLSSDQNDAINEQEDETQLDPRAALMSAISNRAAPMDDTDDRPSGPMNIGALAAAAAMKKMSPEEGNMEALQSSTIGSGDSIEKDSSPTLKEDPRFEKYYRMLKMGLPMGAVKNAMQRDQQDPTIMDLDPDKSLESQRPSEKEEDSDDGPPLSQDPVYEKYFRMLKMGIPLGAVKNGMQRDGLNPDIMDLDHNKSVSSQMDNETLPGATALAVDKALDSEQPPEEQLSVEDSPPLDKDPAYEKYFRMLKMGLPLGAVKNALQRDGIDPDVMDLDPKRSVASQMKTVNDASSVDVSGQVPSAPPGGDDGEDAGRSNAEEQAVLDPRAALTAMLSKRAPPAAEVQPQSTEAPTSSDAQDARSALNAMLTARGGSAAAEEKKEAAQDDPRAALMAAITKRASPAPAEPPADADSTVSTDQNDTKAALNAMLSKRGEQDSVGLGGAPVKPDESAEQQDPRAALMAAITKRAPPPQADKPDTQPSGGPMNIGALAAAAALRKQARPESSDDSAQPAVKDTGDEAKKGEPTIREDPRFAKYFKMLKMGLPMGAVKNAMQRDQQDPSVMDLDPDKSLESQRPPEKADSGDDGPPLNKDPAYEKYFRMLKMGLPMGAVKNAMQRDGLDPDIMDLDHSKSVASQQKEEEEDTGPPLKDDPKYSKYFKMLKMGLPMGAVKNAMQRDGLDPSIMDLDHEKSVASQLQEQEEEGEAADSGPPLKEDPKYSKYFKMLKMGLPMGAVKNALQRDGLDPSIMDLDPEKSVDSQLKKEEDTGPPLKDDPKYSKYFKMLKMGLPMGAVKNALTRDGLDPAIMDLDPEKSEASQLNKEDEEEEVVDTGPPLKDDPKWTKYFKMLKMGLPMGAVKNALTRDGHDPSIMDLDPEKSLESQKAKPGKGKKGKKKLGNVLKKSPMGPKKPKVRRKKLFWSPIEESKIDDNSLWSMVKGTFDFDSLKVDQEEFQNLFTDTSNPADKKKAVAEKPAASKQKKSVQVIDAKRGMNGGIILARIKIEFSVLADMVTEMDCGKLDDTQLKALREFLPTKEEKFAIEGYVKGASSSAKTKEAAINDFCACEKYMLAMMKVDMADEKFEAMLFKYQFDNKLKELMDCVTTLINACEEVQKSVRLRKLMAMILMLGNQINTGGSGRMAQGFTLDALLKLDEAKAFDKKTSVLQYLVKLVKANEPDLLNVHEEMPSIGPAENVIVETLVSELKELNDQLVSVKGTAAVEGRKKRDGLVTSKHLTALERLRLQKTKIKDVQGVNMYNQAEQIQLTAMEKFALYAEKRTREAFARIEEVQENFKGVLAYFGEDPAMTSSDFFGTLNKFIATFDNALEVVKRIEALKIAEEKKAAAKRAKEAAKKTVKAVSAAKQVSDIVSQQQKGKLDLAGQRKKYADPFVGPGAEDKSSDEAKDSESPSKQDKDPEQGAMDGDQRAALMSTISQLALVSPTPAGKTKSESQQKPDSQKEDELAKGALQTEAPLSPAGSSDTSGFFPATTRDVKENSPEKAKSARDERYESKTSSNARGSEAVKFASPPSSPVARGIKRNVLAEQKTHLHHVTVPFLEEKESDSTSETSDRRKRLNRINPYIEADSKTEAKVMLVASMAAAAAKKRSRKAKSSPQKERATLYNSITLSNSELNGPGIASGAPKLAGTDLKDTAAEVKKTEAVAEPPLEATTGGEPASVEAMAVAEPNEPSTTGDPSSVETDGPAKAPSADEAIEEVKVGATTEARKFPTTAEAPSIAAMAAAAALKKQVPVNEESEPDAQIESRVASSVVAPKETVEEEHSDGAPMGIAAMAAADAKRKNHTRDAASDESKPSAKTDTESTGGSDEESRQNAASVLDAGAPMGIAAMAAAAAQKKASGKPKAPANTDTTSEVGSDSRTAKPAPSDDPPKGPLYPCYACGEELEKSRFSKNQLTKAKKKEKARCKQCIEASSK